MNNAIIQPYFTYCGEIWNVFASLPNHVDQQIVLNLSGWETLKTQRVKATAKMMSKTLNHIEPTCFIKLFSFKKES